MIAAFALVSFTVLLAAAALSLDGGALLTERRHAQETADAAALAAAADLFQHYPFNNGADAGGTAAQSALTAAAANGYSNDGTTSLVTVNIPPKTSKTYKDKAGYAEVSVTYKQPPGLSSLFGAGTESVKAHAVARGLWIPAHPQVMVFDLSAGGSLALPNNFGSLGVTGGPVVVNSSSATSMSSTAGGVMSAPEYDLSGPSPGYFTAGQGQFNGPIVNNVRPSPDPLSYLPPPAGLTTQSTTRVVFSDSNLPPNPLPAGVYAGIQVKDDVSLTLTPGGIYDIEGGGFIFNSTGALTGSGVLIYNNPSAGLNQFVNIAPQGSGSVNLSPLTTGPYQGLTIMQNRTATTQVRITGNGNVNITGTVYAPNALVQVTNNDDPNLGSQYMSRTLVIQGNGQSTLSQTPQPSHTRLIGLVE